MKATIYEIAERIDKGTTEQMADIQGFFWLETKDFTEHEWNELFEAINKSHNDYMRLVFLCECITKAETAQNYETYLRLLKETQVIDWNKKYHLLWQIIGRLFTCPGSSSGQIQELMYEIYNDISEEFLSFFDLEYIEERNDNLVFLTIQQFLSDEHGPTKTVLDRARVLRKKLKKNVMIINTAEYMGGEPIGLYNALCASYDDSKSTLEAVEYMGESYPFIQFDNNMPNIYNCRELFEFVKKYKPGMIVNIGGSSLIADGCSKMVPVLNVNTVPSGITRTKATMQVSGNKVSDEAEKLLRKLGKSKEDVLIGRFTSSLKKQEKHFTREQLGIPKDKIALAVVGARLTREMDEEFRKMLHPVLSAGAVLVIVGLLDTYEQLCENDSVFRNNTVYLGFQTDVLAVLECCDIYVNPKRIGGGTSVIEAMSKGLPAVSVNFGDVALGAGETFCVEDYAQMQKVLIRYITDRTFFDEMSQKARERAAYMLDSDSAFVEIINAFHEKTGNRNR